MDKDIVISDRLATVLRRLRISADFGQPLALDREETIALARYVAVLAAPPAGASAPRGTP